MRPQSAERTGCGLHAVLQQQKAARAEFMCAGAAHKNIPSILRSLRCREMTWYGTSVAIFSDPKEFLDRNALKVTQSARKKKGGDEQPTGKT